MEICHGMTPMRVINVDRQGLAHRSGVERGWRIQKVNGNDLTGETFDIQFAILKAAMAPLPVKKSLEDKVESLEIVFIAGENETEVPVVFWKKPLGFDCEVVAPIKVKSIKEDCPARRSGVEVGWIVKKVGGNDIMSLEIDMQIKLLKDSVAALPDVDYRIAPPMGHYSSTAASFGMRDNAEEGASNSAGRL